ncbi:hypothetical protein FB446DRAFT_774635 [Lentinula raphanica]|nr:hypothetical protein FB446DRAFT_774635 [Lentinula raphanica]
MTMMWFDDDDIPRPGKPGTPKKFKGKMWELEVFFEEYKEYADKYRFSKEERVRLVTRHMNWSMADFWKVPVPIPVSDLETPAPVETLLDVPEFPPGLPISLMPTLEVSEIEQELAFMDSTSSITPSDMVDAVPQIQSVSVESELQSDSNCLDPSSFRRSHATFFDSKQNSDSTAVDKLLKWILVYIDLTAFTYNFSALIPRWNWLIYLDAG